MKKIRRISILLILLVILQTGHRASAVDDSAYKIIMSKNVIDTDYNLSTPSIVFQNNFEGITEIVLSYISCFQNNTYIVISKLTEELKLNQTYTITSTLFNNTVPQLYFDGEYILTYVKSKPFSIEITRFATLFDIKECFLINLTFLGNSNEGLALSNIIEDNNSYYGLYVVKKPHVSHVSSYGDLLSIYILINNSYTYLIKDVWIESIDGSRISAILMGHQFYIAYTLREHTKLAIFDITNKTWTSIANFSGRTPNLLRFSDSSFCIVNSEGVWLSSDLHNWTHVFNKSYREPSAVEMPDGRLMIAYVSNISGNDDIWVDIIDLNTIEECDSGLWHDLRAFYSGMPVIAIPLTVVIILVPSVVGVLLYRRKNRRKEERWGKEML